MRGRRQERSAGTPLNVMGAKAVENIGVSRDGKGQPVALGDAGFPNVSPLGIALTLHFLGPKRRVARVVQ